MSKTTITWKKDRDFLFGYNSPSTDFGREVFHIKMPLKPPDLHLYSNECPYELYGNYCNIIGKFKYLENAKLTAELLYRHYSENNK